MTINDKTENEKLQCDIKREAAKVSLVTSGKLLKIFISYRWRNITVGSK